MYDVELFLEDNALTARCDCAYFETDGGCKHLWATILAAEAHGYLSAVNGTTILDDGLWFEGGPDQDADEDDEEFIFQAPPAPKPPPKPPSWKVQIDAIAQSNGPVRRQSENWPSKRQVLYIVEVNASQSAGCLVVATASRDLKGDGNFTRPKSLTLRRNQLAQLPQEDQQVLSYIAGGLQYWGWGSVVDAQLQSSYAIPHPLTATVMPLAAATGRCFLRMSATEWDNLKTLAWDDGGAWRFAMELTQSDKGRWAAIGFFRRGEERMNLATPALITQGLIFANDRVAPLAEDAPFEWIAYLRKNGKIEAPGNERDELAAALLNAPNLPALEVPEELRFEEVVATPRPELKIHASGRHDNGKLRAELSFEYEGRRVLDWDRARGVFDPEKRLYFRRDLPAEKAAAAVLEKLGAKFVPPDYWTPEPRWEIAPTKLPRTVRELVEASWHIEADGKIFRRPGAFHMQVSSGVDWFELHGGVDYGNTSAKLPALLEALRRGEKMVQLDDGTYGLLPEEWLRRIGMVAGAGSAENGHIKFGRSQAGLLDALIATQPEAHCDETFARIREELRVFQGVNAAEQPAGFVGKLREYQREGLGWMDFLRRFSFGGCLADDMGVGKTAQVLAMLETRREMREAGQQVPPSLAVVPRSLVFNWKEEAARFTPRLRVLDHTGMERSASDFSAYDLILTTYGTLRRDAVVLKDIEFDYVVLDEAQAVKNASTESAKAARLLRARHRLALSGTPVENHLGELWALFEFLNPGMLGSAQVFKLAGPAARNPDEETRRLLAHAVRPFILRRTKEQVARELPPKTEQTIYCEMKPEQRKVYNELRDHYRGALLKRIELEGLAKSKIQVLEALLRLRQAACHPGLIDKKRSSENSAKLDSLLSHLREVLDEGHKALVFSQFTSLLAIVRDRLDEEKIVYEYLDGATRNRQARVERFQNDADCRLFLVSLKAGGLGLNLTAAEYVFLLDPWWNPAVEAQAVDRAHRIGQTRQVFAYRLIAKDTVEEKVLELQRTKRDLAAAIISADNSLIRNLGREDLELLLS
ncbi:MAG: DEAD/DEAH box helicase [Bryobacterales bacterium]|nr:DEAD/DEAH box helicase [Bryobacterales bacterium]MBV9401111.1 DEAD/DEAH box helicase [Bryobacterales bacterium]